MAKKDEQSRQGRLKLQWPAYVLPHADQPLGPLRFLNQKALPSIRGEFKTRLWSYVGGIARTNNMKALAVGGMCDHLHVLLSLPPTVPIAKAIQLVKAGSSKWMREHGARGFEWQVGYGAFTIGISQIPGTVNYIRNQEKHHAKRNFAEEWKIFMKRHGLSEGD